MKIAVDFDDVLVNTMEQFLHTFNDGRPQHLRVLRKDITDWYLPPILGVPNDEVRDNYASIDYDEVRPMSVMAKHIMTAWVNSGHKVFVLSANQRRDAIRKKLNDMGLQQFPLVIEGNKAGWCRENYVDVLIDDRPAYLKGAETVGTIAIRFSQFWNQESDAEFSALTWNEVSALIDLIAGDKEDDTVVVNENGAKQSRIDGRFDLIPARALKEVAKVYAEGADKYGEDNWKGLSIDEINNHVYNHLYCYQEEANAEDLSHAACRILMALQLHLEELDKVGPLRI
jgi:5'(3')-deoxyribonucleotidase